jgi:putative ABC transport system ATP-binding protein
MKLLETSNGNTVILVTHEEEIAAYAHRVIRLRDGLIESDTTKYFFSGADPAIRYNLF